MAFYLLSAVIGFATSAVFVAVLGHALQDGGELVLGDVERGHALDVLLQVGEESRDLRGMQAHRCSSWEARPRPLIVVVICCPSLSVKVECM